MTSRFRVDASVVGSAALVRCRGALDLEGSATLERELDRVPLEQRELLVVDLSAVEFMDSTGIGTLLGWYTRARRAGMEFTLVQGPEQVQRVLAISGAADRLTIVATAEDAVARHGRD